MSFKLPWKLQGRKAYEKLKQNRVEMFRRNSSAWPQVCFLHLAKTAGSSLNELLRHRFADHGGVGLSPEELDRRPIGGLGNLGLVSAHFSIRHLPLLADHRFLFTFLRDPVDRVVSNYYYLRAYDGRLDATNATVLASAKTKTFHDFLKDDHPQVRSFTANMQANALAWDWRGEYRKEMPDLGRRAIAALEHFDFVGLFEHYEESLEELFEKLHWRLEPGEAALMVNRTGQRPLVREVEPPTLSLIRELNQADQQLYDFAVARLNPAIQERRAPTRSLPESRVSIG